MGPNLAMSSWKSSCASRYCDPPCGCEWGGMEKGRSVGWVKWSTGRGRGICTYTSVACARRPTNLVEADPRGGELRERGVLVLLLHGLQLLRRLWLFGLFCFVVGVASARQIKSIKPHHPQSIHKANKKTKQRTHVVGAVDAEVDHGGERALLERRAPVHRLERLLRLALLSFVCMCGG